MKSTIKIDMDHARNPILKIELVRQSDDLRDRMLREFFDELGYNSNLARIEFMPQTEINSSQTIHISPIKPGQLQELVGSDNDNQNASICPAQAIEMSNLNIPQWMKPTKVEYHSIGLDPEKYGTITFQDGASIRSSSNK